MLKRFLLATILLMTAATRLHAKNDLTAQQALDAILAQHDFLQAASSPFLLEADFTGQAVVPTKGHLKIRWQSEDHWWSWIDFGEFQQIRIRNGEMEYTVRNAEATPFQISHLFGLFNAAGRSLASTATREVISRTEAGVATECLQARIANPTSDAHELCVDPSTHDLLSDSWRYAPNQTRSQRFADYVQAGSLRYPRQFDVFVNSSRPVSARITAFQSMPFDSALLKPPKGAMERRKCAGLKSPVPIKKVNIEFGTHPGLNTLNTLSLTILTDGSVGDVQIIQSGGPIVDEPALKALKNWKFKPAMCGNQPVIDDIAVEVNYSTFRIPGFARHPFSTWTYRLVSTW